MITTDRDPASMTVQERLGEIAEVLARGYARLRVARVLAQKGLDAPGMVEAECCSKALNPKSEDHAA